MGATGWQYVIPYQPDLNAAVQELRRTVFENREYEAEPTEADGAAAFEQLAIMQGKDPAQARKVYADLMRMARDLEKLQKSRRRRKGGEPKTIEELLEQRAESGTGTILDIHGISPTPASGMLHPLDDSTLRQIFGTTEPSREALQQWRARVPTVDEPVLYKRGQGIYVAVYEHGEPVEIYIEGASGD